MEACGGGGIQRVSFALLLAYPRPPPCLLGLEPLFWLRLAAARAGGAGIKASGTSGRETSALKSEQSSRARALCFSSSELEKLPGRGTSRANAGRGNRTQGHVIGIPRSALLGCP